VGEETGTTGSGGLADGGAAAGGDRTGRQGRTSSGEPPGPSEELARRAEAEAIEEATAAVAGEAARGEGRSAPAGICPFLRRVDDAGGSAGPIDLPDPANLCLALPEPQAQSLRQQQLVCLQAGHVHCPRYVQSPMAELAGAELAGAGLAGVGPAGRARRRVGRPTAVALGILLVSTAAAVGFVLVGGGSELPLAGIEGASPTSGAGTRSAGPSPGAPSAGSAGSAGSAWSAGSASPAAPAGAGSSVAPPAASAAPTPVPTLDATAATPSATPGALAATPTPTSSLLALLDPCPDRVDCYLYTVRRNDTLHRIADMFGVPYSTVRALNPWIVDPNLIRVGDRIVLPPPTR